MIGKIKCLIGYHDFKQVERLSGQSSKVRCKRCDRFFAVNWNLRVVIPWSEDIRDFYRRFKSIYVPPTREEE